MALSESRLGINTQIRQKRLLGGRVEFQGMSTLDQTCLAQLSGPDSFGGVAPSDLLQEPIDNSPDFADVLKEMNPDVKIGPPVLLAQGTADTTVFPSYTDLLDGQLNDLGDDVDYKTYAGITHGGIVAAAEDDAMDFFEQRLPSGRP